MNNIKYIEDHFTSIILLITLAGIIIYFMSSWSILKRYFLVNSESSQESELPISNTYIPVSDTTCTIQVSDTIPASDSTSSNTSTITIDNEDVSSINENEIHNGIDSIYAQVSEYKPSLYEDRDAGSGEIDFNVRRTEHIDRVIK